MQLLSATPQEPSGGTPPVDGDLEVRGLTYRYVTGDSDSARPAALRDINLVFERGRSYAVIGRSGSGKSTLAKILTRAVDVPPGTVFLAGADLRDFDIEGLRRWIAVVPQRTEILAGTVVDNVTLFDDDLRGSAAEALEQLGLSAWVADLPDGMETMLGDGGYVLSAGQEQLVAFARILVRDPHIVILDEATARMDPVTEARVQRATERLLEDRIGIVIAHRLSSVQRCDQVVVLADGQVVEAGPLRDSDRFAQLLSSGRADVVAEAEAIAARRRRWRWTVGVGSRPPATARRSRRTGRPLTKQRRFGDVMSAQADTDAALAVAFRTDPPPLPVPARTRTLRQVIRLATNDARYGLGALAIFLVMIFVGLEGSLLPWLWSDLVDGRGAVFWPAFGIVTALVVAMPTTYYTGKWFPEWWVRQMLRISLRLVHGQTGPRRVSAHTPAEVIAQGGDTERVVQLADNVIDQFACLFMVVSMTVIAKSIVPALFFVGTMVISGLAAMLFGPLLERSARKTVAARAAFATALASSLSAARTVKLAGATRSVLTHLANLDTVRSVRQRREISIQVWARSTPSVVGGLLPLAAWGLYLAGRLSPGATLVAVSTLLAVRWFAWTTASLISQLPSARVWTSRTVSMAGVGAYSANVPGVDLSAGTAPGTGRRASQPAVPPGPRRVQRDPRGRHRRRARHRSDRQPRPVGAAARPGRRGQVVAAAGARRHRAPHRRPVLERRTRHRTGAVPATEPGRVRRADAPRALRHGRRQHPARARTRRRGGGLDGATRPRPGRGRWRARSADRAQGHPALRWAAAAAGAGPGARSDAPSC